VAAASKASADDMASDEAEARFLSERRISSEILGGGACRPESVTRPG